MKLLAFILSVYVMLLISMPCVDSDYDNNLLKIGLSDHKTDNNHNDISHCTPFCTCDCCVIPVIQQDTTIHLDCLEYTYREYAEYNVSYASTLFSCIWQPPELIGISA